MNVIVVHFEGRHSDEDARDMVLCSSRKVVDYWIAKYKAAGWNTYWACWEHIQDEIPNEEMP